MEACIGLRAWYRNGSRDVWTLLWWSISLQCERLDSKSGCTCPWDARGMILLRVDALGDVCAYVTRKISIHESWVFHHTVHWTKPGKLLTMLRPPVVGWRACRAAECTLDDKYSLAASSSWILGEKTRPLVHRVQSLESGRNRSRIGCEPNSG